MYARYQEPFLWLSDFAKHVVDFLKDHLAVPLDAFRLDFYTWLIGCHKADISFQAWAQEYGDTDFRRALVAHAKFVIGQAAQLCSSYMSHPVWEEIGPETKYLQAVARQQIEDRRTIVTPFVYECFKAMAFAPFLNPQRPTELVDVAERDSWSAIRTSTLPRSKVGSGKTDGDINVGDVVKLCRDDPGASEWNDNEHFWYAYVQRLESTGHGEGLRIIWLDAPSHTTCSTMHYPLDKELFLSDHCNCDETDPIPIAEVVSKLSVAFFGSPHDLSTDFFVRQRFSREDATFVQLKQEHFTCTCQRREDSKKYARGETVLATWRSTCKEPILEPVELLAAVDGDAMTTVKVRRLLRKDRDFDDDTAAPNELVYSHVFEDILIRDIERRCLVRFYSKGDRAAGRIPAPYNRNGTADAYYILLEDIPNTPGLKPVAVPCIDSLKQGFDPNGEPPIRKLRGFDVFCGGGNFGRGIEEGGAVEMRWAVDIDPHAIHSYKANLTHPDDVKLYFGSVNDYLFQAMSGQYNGLMARPGEVEVIVGGSPCQGFSNANQHKGGESSLTNVSLIAAFAAFVDFYRPKYAILENVLSVTKCAERDKKNNVFSQMICTFVAMGYQVQQFNLDAWSFGSPQSRSRLFISIAAPGLVPMPPPQASHSHPPGVRSRILGKAANGRPFGRRVLDMITPFKYTTIGKVTSDLPGCYDGRTFSVNYPDHRVSRYEDEKSRTRIACIPRFPFCSTLVSTRAAGLLHKLLVDGHPRFWNSTKKPEVDSKAWQRNNPNALIPTVTTQCSPNDAFMGKILHWIDDRCLTVLEVRRAQGFPDHEVIVGPPSAQWKIVGNSVARTVALVLGMSLRHAWLANALNQPANSKELLEHPPVLSTSADPESSRVTRKRHEENRLSNVVIESSPDEPSTQFGTARFGNSSIRAPTSDPSKVETEVTQLKVPSQKQKVVPIDLVQSHSGSTPLSKKRRGSDAISISSDSSRDAGLTQAVSPKRSSAKKRRVADGVSTLKEVTRSVNLVTETTTTTVQQSHPTATSPPIVYRLPTTEETLPRHSESPATVSRVSRKRQDPAGKLFEKPIVLD